MDNDLKKDYKNSLEFWNSRFGKESQEFFFESTKNWKELAPSGKFIAALSLLSN